MSQAPLSFNLLQAPNANRFLSLSSFTFASYASARAVSPEPTGSRCSLARAQPKGRHTPDGAYVGGL